MQGRLRNERLSVTVDTECAHCGRKMRFEIDSDLEWTCDPGSDRPIVFVPGVNLFELEKESIIDDF